MKKWICLIMIVSMILSGCKSGNNEKTEEEIKTVEISEEEINKAKELDLLSVEEIVSSLSLKEKVSQMMQPAIYCISEEDQKECGYGSILSKKSTLTYDKWQEQVDNYQRAALLSSANIPMIYGQDDVHGVNYCDGAVIFPHNIGAGATHDYELMYKVGLATADEAKLCHMLWNFAPCVALSKDPRWGRTYESYGSNIENITEMALAYTKGLIDGGVVACGKHFVGDGNVVFGTGENSGETQRLIDRGDSTLNEEELNELLAVYQTLIDNGLQTIMLSHSSVNGIKCHENKELISYLKNEMGFEGLVVSDWQAISNISGENYEEKVIKAVNAGIDMLMEVNTCNEAIDIVVNAVENDLIEMDRIDDAVNRIIRVKKNAGILGDPLFENLTTLQDETGSKEYRDLALRMVEESLVLIKNDNDVLPLKKGTKIYVTGPAIDNAKVQCGGWTIDWEGPESGDINGVTTILGGLKEVSKEMDVEIITDYKKAKNADAVIVAVGEKAYAEWNGDSEDIDLYGMLSLETNREAIENARKLNKPVIVLIVAGRQLIIKEQLDFADGIVMCYLPGSEGQGIANVLFGKTDFTGKLPSPWYSSIDQINTDECWLNEGYGLSYK